MEGALEHNLSDVRIHADEAADALNQSLDARAFTTGNDIFFRLGAFQPDAEQGRQLLAHELTHVVQQRSMPPVDGPRVGPSDDQYEQEARTASAVDEPLKGFTARAPSTIGRSPATIIQRADDDDAEKEQEESSGGSWFDRGLDWVKGKAEQAVEHPLDALDSAAGAAENVMLGGAPAAASALFGTEPGKQDQGSLFDRGLDWVEDKEKGATHWLAEKAEGIPVLEQAAKAGEFVVDTQTELSAGVLKGAGTMVGGLAHMAEHPVQALEGIEQLAEHVNVIPGMPNPLKMAHGAYDVLANGKDVGDVANHVFNPLKSMQDDQAFMGNMAKAIIKPYQQEVAQGKYAEAAGRGIFDIGSILLTGGAGAEVEGAADVGRAAAVAGEVTEGVADVGKVAAVTDETSQAARAARVAKEVEGAGATGEAAGDAARGAGDVPREPAPREPGPGGAAKADAEGANKVLHEEQVAYEGSGEVHELKLTEDGQLIRCSDRCMQLAQSIFERSQGILEGRSPELVGQVQEELTELTTSAGHIARRARALGDLTQQAKALREAGKLEEASALEAEVARKEPALFEDAKALDKRMAKVQRSIVGEGVEAGGRNFFPEQGLLEGGKHGIEWTEGPARAISDGKPQGQFANVAEVDEAVRMGPNVTDPEGQIFPWPGQHQSFVWLQDGSRVPATQLYVKVYPSGKVHAYPLP
jgi:hypothetical protein